MLEEDKILVIGAHPLSRDAIEAALTEVGKEVVVSKDTTTNKIDNFIGFSSFSSAINQARLCADIGKSISPGSDIAAFGMRYSNSRKAKTRRIKNKKRK